MKQILASVMLVAFLGAAFFATREVCEPIPDISGFTPIPIEQRQDKILWIKTFQQKNGEWHQCKPLLWRVFFF
jgi:hypothetical protein